MAVPRAEGEEQLPGTSPPVPRCVARVDGRPVEVVGLVPQHGENRAAVADDLASKPAPLEHESPARPPVVIAVPDGSGIDGACLGSRRHT